MNPSLVLAAIVSTLAPTPAPSPTPSAPPVARTFRFLRHEHYFEDLNGFGTRMTDRMTISAPLGPLGAVVTRALIAPYQRRLLKRRTAHIKCLAEARNRT
ncbi:hypothetical protein GCM10022225_08110 [Plantactinospora mayteni]|uniref:Uncharacterized protein n=1 Tax=Plantactinospora mayteni TaxID=566021 RepID=A0ABQ4EI91_9ACTN|nr:hypothetical protein Pma05_10160 [Plantactinospora mayteni]